MDTKAQPDSDQAEMIELHASQPGWPSIRLPWKPPLDPGVDLEPEKLNLRAAYHAIKRAFEQSGDGVEVIGYNRTVLLEEGVLEVPILLRKGNLGVAVYIYPQGDTMDASHFAGVQEALQRLDYMPPVYYAPRPLPASQPVDPLRSFGLDLFRHAENSQAPTGTYAMWWPTDDESLFCSSKSHRLLGEIYQTLNGIESYFVAKMLRTFGRLPPTAEDPNRVPLTEESATLFFFGPELVPVYFVAADQLGIQFYLHAESSSRVYRERFYKHLLGYLRRERERIEEAGLPLDDYTGDMPNPLNWWLLAERTVQLRESQGAQMEYFGGLEALLEDNLVEDQPTLASPADVDQRQSAPAKRSDKTTRILYSAIVVLIVIWTIVAGVVIFGKGKPTALPAEDRRAQPPPAPADSTVLPVALTPTVALPPGPDDAPTDDTTALITPEPPDEGIADDGTIAPPDPLLPGDDGADPVDEGGEPTIPPDDGAAPPDAADGGGGNDPMNLVAGGGEPLPPEPVETGPFKLHRRMVALPRFNRDVSSLAFARNGPIFCVVERDVVRIYDVRRLEHLKDLPGTTATLSSNGSHLAAHIDGISTFAITEIATGRKTHTLGRVESIRQMLFSPDDRLLATVGTTLRVWQMADGAQRLAIPDGATVSGIAFLPGGEQLALLRDGANEPGTTLLVHSLETGEVIRQKVFDTKLLAFLRVGFQTRDLYVANDLKVMRLAGDTLEVRAEKTLVEGKLTAIEPAEDANLVILLTDSPTVWLWHLDSDTLTATEAPFIPTQATYSSSSKVLALRSGQTVALLNVGYLPPPAPPAPPAPTAPVQP